MIAILAELPPYLTPPGVLAVYRPDFTLATLFAVAVVVGAAVVAGITLRK